MIHMPIQCSKILQHCRLHEIPPEPSHQRRPWAARLHSVVTTADEAKRHLTMVYQPLLEALLDGSPLEDIRSIMEEAPEEEIRGQALYDVIAEAMRNNDFATIRSDVIVFLIQQDPNCAFLRCPERQHYLLDKACLNGVAEVIQHLVHLNPSAVNEADDKGYYPLHNALIGDASLETVKMLVNHGADLVHTKTMDDGQLPVHLACQNAGADVARFLIQQYREGAGTIDRYGCLPIHEACSAGAPLDLIRLLIEVHPACLQVQDSHGRLPLHYASYYGRLSVNTLQLFLVLYPDGIHVPDNDGWLPLHLACCQFNRNLDQVLLLVHSDPLTLLRKTPQGSTPLKLSHCFPGVPVEIKAFLLKEQESLVRAHRYAVEFVAKVQLGFSDLAVNKIWQFAQPDVWHPSDENDDSSDEMMRIDVLLH